MSEEMCGSFFECEGMGGRTDDGRTGGRTDGWLDVRKVGQMWMNR